MYTVAVNCLMNTAPSGRGLFTSLLTDQLVGKVLKENLVPDFGISQYGQGHMRLCAGDIIADDGIIAIDFNDCS